MGPFSRFGHSPLRNSHLVRHTLLGWLLQSQTLREQIDRLRGLADFERFFRTGERFSDDLWRRVQFALNEHSGNLITATNDERRTTLVFRHPLALPFNRVIER